MKKARLQVYLAHCGVASRRKCEEYIKQGRVDVNGSTVTDMGVLVDSCNDEILFDKKKIVQNDDKVYILLNKPIGYVTTTNDQFGRKCVLDLLEGINMRVYPVGRLDYNTSGLLLLTNDGDFAYKVTHPKHKIRKVYKALVQNRPNEKDLQLMRNGIFFDGRKSAPAKVELISCENNSTWLHIEIHEGRNRQVRKMCDKIGCPVIKLERTETGSLKLNELKAGEWRYLEIDEAQKVFNTQTE